MHCSVLPDQRYNKIPLLLDTSIILNETDNMNAVTVNRNLAAKAGNGNKHQQNSKKNQNKKKIKSQAKNRKKENQFSY